jgi:DNA-directed RNA polymerase specialized sigma24 family protein
LRDKLAHHRAAKRSVYLSAADSEFAISARAAPEADASSAFKSMVDDYPAMLPPPDREVVALRMTGHSIAEIVIRAGGPLRAVERILKRSREQLVQSLSA